MGPLVALHVEQRVPIVDQVRPLGTERDILTLAVPGDQEAMSCRN